MQYRQLGSSGIEVSALALGTMMFGKWGNPDESACQSDGRRCARRRGDVVRHRRHLRLRRLGGDPRSSPGRSSRQRRAGDQGRQRDERRSARSGACRGVGSCSRARPACGGWAPTTSTSTRCTAPIPTLRSTRRCRRSTSSCRPARSVRSARRRSLSAQLDEARSQRRASGRDGALQRAAAVLAARAQHRGRSVAVVPAARRRRARVGAVERRMADGQVPVGLRRRGVARRPESPTTSITATRRFVHRNASSSIAWVRSPTQPG